jgi:uncharacterized LabA/DUF88 family protein
MAQLQDHISMALFCDFENVALGVRDANYEKFDIKRVLERLLLKGSIVVKKAYCDWERYKGFKAAMHEANFELIEIPHVRQSGKNSADIRLVVDALDLCYTKSHVNTFVIISGDSDFSPLVSKLRENAKYVIGVGVKQSTSDLLIANCDEFIFYDDLVRDSQRQRRDNRDQPQQRRSPEEEARRKAEMDARRTKAVEMAAETYEALVTDRDEGGRIWASVLKEAIKRRNPGFNENYYGFRTFGNLLEEAQQRGLLEFGRDEKSGAYVSRGTGQATRVEAVPTTQTMVIDEVVAVVDVAPGAPAVQHGEHYAMHDAPVEVVDATVVTETPDPASGETKPRRQRGGRGAAKQTSGKQADAKQPATKTGRGTRKPASSPAEPADDTTPATPPQAAATAPIESTEAPAAAAAASPASGDEGTPARKTSSRARRPRKPAAKKTAKPSTAA